jgi:hypothetical protein
MSKSRPVSDGTPTERGHDKGLPLLVAGTLMTVGIVVVGAAAGVAAVAVQAAAPVAISTLGAYSGIRLRWFRRLLDRLNGDAER